MRFAIAVAISAVAGCGYRPGSFTAPHQPFASQRMTLGCLDVGVAARARTEWTSVVEYDFGNRCDHPAVVDLAAVRVVGRAADGREVALVARDPNQELRALPIDGRSAGRETIAYESDRLPIAQVCVDAGAIAHESERWLCFAAAQPVAVAQSLSSTSVHSEVLP